VRAPIRGGQGVPNKLRTSIMRGGLLRCFQTFNLALSHDAFKVEDSCLKRKSLAAKRRMAA
jgi:hypothetical protein